jgi:hypothetical protein
MKNINRMLKLPDKEVMGTIKENENCTRYLDPLLTGLFKDTIIRTNEKTNVSKEKNNILSSNRPDEAISLLNGVKWTFNQGFGEAKCASEANNNYLTSNRT